MRRAVILIPGLAVWLATSSMAASAATTVLQCEDADGNHTFQERCPPGAKAVIIKQIQTGSRNSTAILDMLQEEKPVVLFRVANCEACDRVRSYLRCRGVPFAEKDVSNNAAVQEELMTKTGELSVPVITIGDEVVDGYSDADLKHHLDAAGYPDQAGDEPQAVRAVSQQP